MLTTLITIVTSHNAIFCYFAIMGFLAHYLKKIAKKEIKMSLKKYFITNNPAASAMAIIALIMAIAITLSSGITLALTISQKIVLGFMTGFMSDSIFNNAAEKVASDAGVDTTAVKAVLDDASGDDQDFGDYDDDGNLRSKRHR